MQELLREILPWIAAFYLFDALVSVRRGQIVLASPFGGHFRLLRAGLHHLGWSPTAEAIATVDLPCLDSDVALLAFDARRQADLATIDAADVVAIPWSSVDPQAYGKKVVSGGRTLALAPHPLVAARLAAELRARSTPGPQAGSGAAGGPADGASYAAIRGRQRPWRLALQATALLLVVWLFGWGSLLAYGEVSDPRLLKGGWILASLFVLQLAFAAGHARSGGARWSGVLAAEASLLFWPVAALHPMLHLSIRAAARFSGLEIASAVLPPAAFVHHAAVELGRAEVSLAAAHGDLAEALSRRVGAITTIAARAGIGLDALRLSPERRPGDTAWCPTCRAGYVTGAKCAECGVTLRLFDPAA